MATFQFIAINNKGVKQKGMLEAESARDARQLLRDQGLCPLEVQATAQKLKHFYNKSLSKPRISSKELALITRQLATLFAAGLPIEEVLAAVCEQTEHPQTKALISAVRSKVLEGHSLASSLREFPNAFSALYSATVEAGEKSGHLDIVLTRLADYTEQQFAMRQKIQHALIYPSIMMLVAVGIVGFLLEYVVPKMIAVYSNIGQTLPGMTTLLIGISEAIQQFGVYFLLGLGLAIFLLRRTLKKNLSFKNKVHRILLKLPIFGSTIQIANTARFGRTFAILSAAGVPIIEAMKISGALITNLIIRAAIEDAAKHVREGANIHLALKQTTFFPPMSIHLIASGEASGQLEAMLERAANNQEGDVTRLIETSLALFEPAIILIMGAVVLFIVLAVLLPIFQLDQLAG